MNKIKLDKYKKQLSSFTSGDNINMYLDDSNDKILKYSALSQYKNIDELFNNVEKDYRIILIENKYNSGHWVCILKDGEIIEEFDSYGCKIDNEFRFINNAIEKVLGENKRFWKNIKHNSKNKYKFIYNNIDFQTKSDQIGTCGRWVILRIMMFKMGYKLNEFINFMKNQKEKSNKPYDIIICDFINKY